MALDGCINCFSNYSLPQTKKGTKTSLGKHILEHLKRNTGVPTVTDLLDKYYEECC